MGDLVRSPSGGQSRSSRDVDLGFDWWGKGGSVIPFSPTSSFRGLIR
jgi:hypothetical protein